MASNCTGERSFSQVMPEAPEDSTPVNHIARQAERLRVEEHCKWHIATKRDFTVIITEFASQKSRTTVHGVRLIRRQTVYCLKLYPRVVGLHTAQFSFTVQCNWAVYRLPGLWHPVPTLSHYCIWLFLLFYVVIIIKYSSSHALIMQRLHMQPTAEFRLADADSLLYTTKIVFSEVQ